MSIPENNLANDNRLIQKGEIQSVIICHILNGLLGGVDRQIGN